MRKYKNKLDNEKRTRNYTEHCAAISQLSIVNIVKIVDYINLLKHFVNKENEILDDLDEAISPFNDIIEKLWTKEQCMHHKCGGYLYKSDLPQYDFVCPACDENF